MSYFIGTACFSPKVPSWIETVWSMNGGKVILPRALYPQFSETVGRVPGVDWLFALDETDPWVKTWQANSNVVFHASYVLQVVSKRVDQALVPMRNFIIGNAGPKTQHFSPNNLSEPPRDEFTIRSSPPAKVTSLSAPLDAPKISGRVSLLRSPLRDSRAEQSPYARRKNAPPSIDLAKQSTLVDYMALHNHSERTKQDSAFVPLSHTPLAPAVAAPLCQDCPRIDLVKLVREKQKAKKPPKKKLTAPPLQKERRRRVIPRDSGYEKPSRLDFNARGSRRDPRKPVDPHAHQSPTSKKRSVSVYPVPRIFKPISPSDCISVFDGIGRHWIND